jgi:hypothetical protein
MSNFETAVVYPILCRVVGERTGGVGVLMVGKFKSADTEAFFTEEVTVLRSR